VHNYQQAGRLRGFLRVDGAELEIDCPSNRDRSWGPRNFNQAWNEFPRHQWPWFNDGVGFAGNIYTSAQLLQSAPASYSGSEFVTPEAHFAEEMVKSGWLLKDGLVGNTVGGSYEVVKRRPDGLPLTVNMYGIDEHGREFRAKGRALNFIRRPGR
jgi:hypothetical protein